jgi:hypothetical protein
MSAYYTVVVRFSTIKLNRRTRQIVAACEKAAESQANTWFYDLSHTIFKVLFIKDNPQEVNMIINKLHDCVQLKDMGFVETFNSQKYFISEPYVFRLGSKVVLQRHVNLTEGVDLFPGHVGTVYHHIDPFLCGVMFRKDNNNAIITLDSIHLKAESALEAPFEIFRNNVVIG